MGSQKVGEKYWPNNIANSILLFTLEEFFVFAGSNLIHFICQFLDFLIYVPGYFYLSKVYDRYRINQGVSRPWELKDDWPAKKKKLFTILGINYCLIYPLLILASLKLGFLRLRFDNFPSVYFFLLLRFEVFWQLLFIILVEDAVTYWYHRTAHESKFLYKYHKVHHEYNEVFTLTTEYFHPLDYTFGILIPSAIPFFILGSKAHCFMFLFWQMWKIFESTEAHCGYEFPWSPIRILPFASGPSFHDFHHSKNVGTYCGIIYLWDHFNNSSGEYFSRRYPQLSHQKKE